MTASRWQEPNLARNPFVNERPIRRLAMLLWLLAAIAGAAGFWRSQAIRQDTGTRVAELARLTAQRATREKAPSGLVPPEFTTRYRQQLPIRAESNTVNRVRVSFQCLTDGIPARGIPQAQIGVQTARDDTLAVGAKSDATHCTAIFDRLTDGIPGTGIP